MSGSETGVISSNESYSIGFRKNPVPAPAPSPIYPVIHNIRLSYDSEGKQVFQPVTGSSPQLHTSASGSDGSAVNISLPHNLNMKPDTAKRKRGRPRKYGYDGSMPLTLVSPLAAVPAAVYAPAQSPPAAVPATVYAPSIGAFSPSLASAVAAPAIVSPGVVASQSSFKKARGRPAGSTNKPQMEALGSAGGGVTAHIIIVDAGEDVLSKIMSFPQHGSQAVCILSAIGAISNVSLRQASTYGGTATYEGRFDILSLSGSFLLTEVGGQRSRSGGLSITLAGPDARVFGGCVAGLLTAASPVQVVVGSFIADGCKQPIPLNQMEPLSVPHKTGGARGSRSPPSHGTLSESGGGASQLNQSTRTAWINNNANPTQGLTMSSMPWK